MGEKIHETITGLNENSEFFLKRRKLTHERPVTPIPTPKCTFCQKKLGLENTEMNSSFHNQCWMKIEQQKFQEKLRTMRGRYVIRAQKILNLLIVMNTSDREFLKRLVECGGQGVTPTESDRLREIEQKYLLPLPLPSSIM